jgi:hypothetical protein
MSLLSAEPVVSPGLQECSCHRDRPDARVEKILVSWVRSAPPDQEIRRCHQTLLKGGPPSLRQRKKDLPDMYISSPDMMSPGLSTGRVFVSLTPNEKPRSQPQPEDFFHWHGVFELQVLPEMEVSE